MMGHRNGVLRRSLSAVGIAALLTVQAATVRADPAVQVPVPPPNMGWASWNPFGPNISEAIIKQQADALAQFDATFPAGTPRYTHLNIDDGWWRQYNGRDASGAPLVDRSLWTNGSLATAARYIKSKGLIAGAYGDIGKTGCDVGGGSEGYYGADMMRFALWGFEFVKIDFCGGRAENIDPQHYYTLFAQALQAAEKNTGLNIYLSLCDWGYYGPTGFPDAAKGPWSWAPGVSLVPADSFRTADDITFNTGPNGSATFKSVVDMFHANYHPEAQHTGYYNDPDMLVAGINGVDSDASLTQSKANMNLWAVSGAPLILGNDMTKVLQTPALAQVLSNGAMLAVDQDRRGLQAIPVSVPATGVEVWARSLSGSGRRAVVFLNATNAPVNVAVTSAQLGLSPDVMFQTYDVWTRATGASASGSYAVSVPAQGTVMLTVQGVDLPNGPTGSIGAASGSAMARTATIPSTTAPGTASVNEGPTTLDVTYVNASGKTLFNAMTVNGLSDTTVAFPPTQAGNAGTISVIANLHAGVQNTVAFKPVNGTASPGLQSVAVVAAPVPAFQATYHADAAGNVMAGGAFSWGCSTCSDGTVVGYVGNGGTLTFNDVTAPRTGQYTILVSYLNGDSGPRDTVVSVNGAQAGTFSFPAGKNWNTVLVAPITVTLLQGANKIMFSNPNGWTPNFDSLGTLTAAAQK